jgi:Tol biopolymer transport system component
MIIGAPAQAAPAGSAQRVAFVRAGSVHVRSGATESRLTRDADDTRPRWSPDGTRIAYGHAGRLWVMNADGTGSHALTGGPAGGADWSPDGRWLAFAAPGCTGIDGVFKVAAAGGTPEALFPASRRRGRPGGPRRPVIFRPGSGRTARWPGRRTVPGSRSGAASAWRWSTTA